MTTLPIVLVAAIADNGVIGSDNRLIWRLKTDLKRFRQLTMGCPIIMGRKTFRSFGRALPGRQTIVLTRGPAFSAEGIDVAH
ncbi:MAG: dihydrofolate reductase, partial [Bosea sp.]|nr:dihydrofolate reductase [Bosea sp. (in: a-proteobacteria)]